MNKLDIINAMKFERVEYSKKDKAHFAVYKTGVTMVVPVPADFDVNDLEKSIATLDIAKRGATEAVYGNLVETLIALREDLPKAHRPKVNKLIRQYLKEGVA